MIVAKRSNLNRAFLLALAVFIGAALVVPAAPASATVTGPTTFECRLTLPAWPGSGSGGCEGLAAVSVAGIDDQGEPYSVAGPANFVFGFFYDSTCLASEGPPTFTFASGGFIASGIPSVGLPVEMTGEMSWTVIGAEVLVFTDHTVLTLPNGHTATALTADSGVAEFVPILGAANQCPFGGALTGFVAGEHLNPF